MTEKGTQWVVKDPKENMYWPSEAMKKKANLNDPKIYEQAAKDQIAFWAKLAKDGKLFGYPFSGYWKPIGTFEQYEEAISDLEKGKLKL